MKILLINKFLFPKGGDAISTITAGKLLSSRGHEVIFWGMDSPMNPEYEYKNYFIPYVDFNAPNNFKNKLKLSLNMLYSFEAKRKIETLLKKVKPDIIHLNNFAHQISPSILHTIKKFRIPVAMTMRDYKLVCPTYSMLLRGIPCERCKNRKFYHCLINKCAKNSYSKSLLNTIEMYLHHSLMHIYDLIDVYVSPSRFLKAECEKMGLKYEIEYLPNFIDLNEFIPNYQNDGKSVLYFGRLSKEKGLLTLLNAVKGLGINLKIIGDGPLKEELILKSRNENINNVEFLGYQSGSELKDTISKSVFVVLPTECFENNPRMIIESFASGKPAIGARIGGIPELVKDNLTGFTFTAGDASDLKAKILQLFNSGDNIYKMGKNARELVEKENCSEIHYDKLINIYKKTISKNLERK